MKTRTLLAALGISAASALLAACGGGGGDSTPNDNINPDMPTPPETPSEPANPTNPTTPETPAQPGAAGKVEHISISIPPDIPYPETSPYTNHAYEGNWERYFTVHLSDAQNNPVPLFPQLTTPSGDACATAYSPTAPAIDYMRCEAVMLNSIFGGNSPETWASIQVDYNDSGDFWGEERSSMGVHNSWQAFYAGGVVRSDAPGEAQIQFSSHEGGSGHLARGFRFAITADRSDNNVFNGIAEPLTYVFGAFRLSEDAKSWVMWSMPMHRSMSRGESITIPTVSAPHLAALPLTLSYTMTPEGTGAFDLSRDATKPYNDYAYFDDILDSMPGNMTQGLDAFTFDPVTMKLTANANAVPGTTYRLVLEAAPLFFSLPQVITIR